MGKTSRTRSTNAAKNDESSKPITSTAATEQKGPPGPSQPTPPDGGWGWVVVVASFFSNLIVDGVLYTFGVLYVELLVSFPEAGKAKIALIGSLLGGIYLIGGPIVSALANKFGCRPVAIGGSIMASVAFFVSSISPSVEMLLATYGFIGGFGFGMLYLPSIVMVGLYFDKRRAMATGIAVCGSGIGTFLFAPLARILLDEYGWRGTNIIMSAIVLHGIACGAVYLPLTIKAPKKKKKTEQKGKKGKNGKELPAVEPAEMVRPFQRQDVLYTGSVTNLNEYKASGGDMESYINSVTSIPKGEKETRLSPVISILKTMFDVTLLASPTFIFVCLSGVCGFMGFFTPFVYLADYSIGVGVNTSQASLLLSVVGLCNTVGRLLAGWLADRPWADSLIIHNVAIILAGVATCLVPLLENSILLFIYSAVFGVTIAAFIALRSIVLCDLLGVQKLTNAFGLVVLFQGIAILSGTYLSGAIYDGTGSYTISFVVAGIIMAVGGIVCLPIRRIASWEEKRNKKRLGLIPDAATVTYTAVASTKLTASEFKPQSIA